MLGQDEESRGETSQRGALLKEIENFSRSRLKHVEAGSNTGNTGSNADNNIVASALKRRVVSHLGSGDDSDSDNNNTSNHNSAYDDPSNDDEWDDD